MRLFIAEKHTQAEALARYLSKYGGDPLRAPEREYLAVGGDVVTWAQGHLYTDARPEDYDVKYKSWEKAHLPIVPERWLRLPVMSGNPANQLRAIKKLLKHATLLIHACDFDREGQLIGNDIFDNNGVSVPVMRLPLTGYDDVSIQRAFDALAPNEENDNLANAARARSESDWLIGINGTRGITLVTKEAGYRLQGAIPMGRVISPTLCLIVDRAEQIEHFMPVNYFEVWVALESRAARMALKLQIPEGTLGLDDDGRLVNREVAGKLKTRVEAARTGRVFTVKDDVAHEHPALPFSMASIQQELNKRTNLTAEQIYKAVQALYNEHFLISYPRGNCRYYQEQQHADGPALLAQIAKNIPDLAPFCTGANPLIKSAAFDSAKVGAHPAIAPLQTSVDLDELPAVERQVYELIARRYVQQFYPPAEYLTKEFTVIIDSLLFTKKYRSLANEGWLVTRENGAPSEKAEDPPRFEPGDTLEIIEVAVQQKTTKPPKPFTDGTLIAAINSVEKYVKDEELRALLGTDASIGTEATQTKIIENLIASRCIERKNKALLPTKTGKVVASVMPPQLQGPGLTALYEKSLEKIAVGALPAESFVREQRRLAAEIVQAILSTKLPPAEVWNGPDPRKRESREGGATGGGREYGAGAA